MHTLRHFETLEDFRACVALQEEIWGAGFSERVPLAILKVGQSLAGVSAGAFAPSGRLDGFVFGLTGLDDAGAPVHWSDMLAVRPDVAASGLGTRLKAFQRDAVLARGVSRMLWTFDPLRARNAHLNLGKLGAVVREYRRDMYGDTDSVLHRGIGTDRFVAIWDLEHERTRARLSRALGESRETQDAPLGSAGAAEAPELALGAITEGDLPRPGTPRLDLDRTRERVGIAIPAELGPMLERDPDLAIAWRKATRAAFLHYLGRRFEARELLRGPVTATYVLERRPEPDVGSGQGENVTAVPEGRA